MAVAIPERLGWKHSEKKQRILLYGMQHIFERPQNDPDSDPDALLVSKTVFWDHAGMPTDDPEIRQDHFRIRLRISEKPYTVRLSGTLIL